MDDDKTEQPTGRKIQKAREEGNVIKSPDVNAFLSLLVGLSLVFICFSFWVEGIASLFYQIYSLFQREFTLNDIISLALSLAYKSALLLAPIFLSLILTGIIANISQSGFLLTTNAIKPKLQKLNFISGLKSLISFKKIRDGFLITFKVFVAFIIGFFVFLSFIDELSEVALFPLAHQMRWLRDKAPRVLAKGVDFLANRIKAKSKSIH